jgi:hypothetical protein
MKRPRSRSDRREFSRKKSGKDFAKKWRRRVNSIERNGYGYRTDFSLRNKILNDESKKMVLSLGRLRSTLAYANGLLRMTPEIIECDCPECNGLGLFLGHPEFDSLPCVACKGTGRIYA